ncbi:helix-turn-helix domain-containing protein [Lactococcus lactis]|uniref:helix-turn-helix domain-containing protein n=1 Tax=Lactococcus lactis TaxID=1358 RepID=UPI0022DFAFF0|nr:helix-turn-helix domain-containing protein [Lactococcus lactis]MDA2886077.1 helix-turn-helix domain-containing protein [Lactococcus lactis]MDA2888607.1 helix-turn-helix domain-containing protein [Lactococcus lactis]MDA2908490.1 helix-turn-helix domain-containing protein [Lactococcus lactis]
MKKIRLPEMIDYFRKENGWTMKEFGEKLGKSESAISKWIKGVRSPMVEDFDKMVNLFNTDPDTLMYGASDLSTTLSEINKISSQLEEPRQKIVLETASSQLKEQEEQKSKIVSIKNEQEKFDLADLVNDSKVDWDKWVSFDGRPLTDEVKEVMKKALGKELEDK